MEDRIGRVQYPAERSSFSLRISKVSVSIVVARDEVHDGHIVLLAVAVAAPDTLFDALRVPGQVVVDTVSQN